MTVWHTDNAVYTSECIYLLIETLLKKHFGHDNIESSNINNVSVDILFHIDKNKNINIIFQEKNFILDQEPKPEPLVL